MCKFNLVKIVIAAGGFLCIGSAEFALGQSSPTGVAALTAMTSPSAPRAKSAAPPDLLEGLTLANGQQAKIEQIREQTKSRVAAVDADKQLSPEAADAMRRGYQRLENGKILEVLTPEQQRQVRRRIATWRASTGTPQYPSRRVPSPEQTPSTP
jgi:hypothetical protein